jgi:GMP reductase
LILHGGVDIVKVGIGPGSACTTRLKAGVGYPQLSAIDECSHAAHGLKAQHKHLGLICADGGCRTPADVVKAFAAGADFVMLGGMIAGTDECSGEWSHINGSRVLTFYGMSSHAAQEKYGGIKNYRASEGRVKTVEYKGEVSDVIDDILGGIRSACAYVGADSIKDLPKCAEFVKVNRVHFDKTL